LFYAIEALTLSNKTLEISYVFDYF